MTKNLIGMDTDIVDSTSIDVPSERTFREAWVLNRTIIQIDMPKAKLIRQAQLKLEAKPLFEELDIDFMRALETDADRTEIIASKQSLRDTINDPRITAAKTTDDLDAVKI